MKILVADDEPAARYAMVKALRGTDRQILEAADGEIALSCIQSEGPDLVLLDLNMPGKNGLAVLSELQQSTLASRPEIIVVTANDSVSQAIECIRRGAADYLTKPYDVELVRAIARRSQQRVALQNQVAALQAEVGSSNRFGAILGSSPAMKNLFGQIERAARSDLPVLIRGESGTGKELVARELHQRGARARRSLVTVNTAAIPESLIESELFGHVKGAFTGADRPRDGVFRQADGGTLLLDEIGDMPYAVQTRLLRVLQESVVQPVGSEQNVTVDVRVVSATHQDLEQAIADKAFRQDLYFRLKGIELVIPPLRHRREDILPLAAEFAGSQCQFSSEAIATLIQHPWTGNVRELKQRVQSAAAMKEGEQITSTDLGLQAAANCQASSNFERYLELPLAAAHQAILDDYDRQAVERALHQESGNITAAAKRLGMHRQSLQQKMRQLGIR